MNSRNSIPDLSYYRLSLADFLRESHPERFSDDRFIDCKRQEMENPERNPAGMDTIFWISKNIDLTPNLDRWVRHRIRYCIRHSWKLRKRRCKNLIRLGINHITARLWSNPRMGGWATARKNYNHAGSATSTRIPVRTVV